MSKTYELICEGVVIETFADFIAVWDRAREEFIEHENVTIVEMETNTYDLKQSSYDDRKFPIMELRQ